MNINDTLKFQNVDLPEDILRRKMHGDYDGAIRLIDRRLADPATPSALRQCLEAHKEMILRLPGEFPYTREEALAIIRENIPDFTEEEFDEYVDDRRIRWIYVNGVERYFYRFYSSLCKSIPEFARRAEAKTAGAESANTKVNMLDTVIAKMQETGSTTNRIRIRATLKLKDEHFIPGMFIRAHLPIPAECDQQSDIRIEKLFPENGIISPGNAVQRTVCWEENMAENHEFVVEYSYLHKAVYHDAYHLAGQPSGAVFDTEEEAPHIVFTPYIRHLVAELTFGLTDPMEKARACWDFITKNMNYTYMPDYFVLNSIADTCAKSLTGDCGVFALLFITMCRCAGIPAQWQSGLAAEPDFVGCHDWARFYVEPYGWLYADPSYGISANRSGSELRREFYFGNLDAYRMVANSAFQKDFTIPKEHWRSDPYDNQSGEMETADHGFTHNEYVRSQEMLLCEEQ